MRARQIHGLCRAHAELSRRENRRETCKQNKNFAHVPLNGRCRPVSLLNAWLRWLPIHCGSPHDGRNGFEIWLPHEAVTRSCGIKLWKREMRKEESGFWLLKFVHGDGT
jgi:hypothetical protein